MTDTLNYYERHAAQFVRDTLHVDMSALRTRFLERLPKPASILDAGCGSGRDSRAFLDLGHHVTAIDASPVLARLAEQVIGQPVEVRRIESVEAVGAFDGIWCCASLLHLPEGDLPSAFQRLWRALSWDGVLYVSFKYGDGTRWDGGRHFTDGDEERLRQWVSELTPRPSEECWQSLDARPGCAERWLNALLQKQS